MKKFVLTAGALCLATSLMACSTKSDEASATASAAATAEASAAPTEETSIANPWVDYETLEEAEAAVGFDVTLPPEKDMYPNIVYRVNAEEKVIEMYAYNAEDQLTVRKGEGKIDNLSGVYEDYDAHLLHQGDNVTATLDGTDEDHYYVAQWANSDESYSYSIYVTVGLSEESMLKMVNELQ